MKHDYAYRQFKGQNGKCLTLYQNDWQLNPFASRLTMYTFPSSRIVRRGVPVEVYWAWAGGHRSLPRQPCSGVNSLLLLVVQTRQRWQRLLHCSSSRLRRIHCRARRTIGECGSWSEYGWLNPLPAMDLFTCSSGQAPWTGIQVKKSA